MKKRLVILGSGFGAFRFLKKIDTEAYDVISLSPRNHFLFTPLLCSTTVGTIEFRSIIEPIRNVKGIRFYQAECTKIDKDRKTIECKDADTGSVFELSYDILVIAVGELTNTFGIEGVREHAMFLREAAHSRKIRNKIIDCFENASLPDVTEEEKRALLGFVVCGGGATGVEFAAELHDFIEEDVKKKYPELVEYISVLLIEAGTKLLNTFDEKLSEYTMKIFGRQKIKVITKSYITKITDKSIFLNDGSTLHYGLLVWATGNTASELIASTDMPKNNKNKLIVNGHMEVKDNAGIYAIGDCSENTENPYPATAQVAQQEGLYLGKQLNNLAKGKQSKPFSFADFGMLAYVGSHKALANMKQYKGSGFATWIFWRSVYLTKLVSTKNKMLVLFDWFKNFLFGRDISNF